MTERYQAALDWSDDEDRPLIATWTRGGENHGWWQRGGNPGGLNWCGHMHRSWGAAERCHAVTARSRKHTAPTSPVRTKHPDESSDSSGSVGGSQHQPATTGVWTMTKSDLSERERDLIEAVRALRFELSRLAMYAFHRDSEAHRKEWREAERETSKALNKVWKLL